MGLESSLSLSDLPPTAPPLRSGYAPSFFSLLRTFNCQNGAIVATGMSIVFVYLSFCVVIVGPWLWLTNTWGMCKFIFISTLSFMVVYNLLQAYNTDPGWIPPGWTPADASTEALEEARSRKDIYRRDFRNKIRYCDVCQAFKPPRCHHCRVCQRCVLKMDHHCPWISACIGYHNQKYYLLFLIYGILTAVVLLSIYTAWYYNVVIEKNEAQMEIDGGLIFKVVLATINVVLLAVALVLVSILLSKQISLVCKNVTTIEVWEKIWAEQDCLERGQAYNHVWDLGRFKNLQQAFGSNVLLWPFPSLPEGNGINFPTNGRPEVIVVDAEKFQDQREDLSSSDAGVLETV